MKKKIELFLLFILLVFLFLLVREKSAAFFNNLGNSYYGNASYDQAIEAYNRSIKLKPDYWIPHLGLANSYAAAGRYDMAVLEYRKALRLNPGCSEALNALLQVYIKERKYNEAFSLISDSAIKDDQIKESSSYACRLFLSEAMNESINLFFGSDKAGAIGLLAQSLEKCHGNAQDYYTLGIFNFMEGYYQEAERLFNLALAVDPDFDNAYKMLGLIHFGKGNREEAEKYWNQAIAINSKDASSYHDLGLLLMDSERYSEALFYLRKAVELDPSNKDYLYSLASTYRDNKMLNEALGLYKKLENVQADYPNLHNDLGDIYRNLGEEEKALKEYRKEIEYCEAKLKFDGNNPLILNDYANSLDSIGESRAAKEIAERLIRNNPDFRQGYLTLARIYENLNMKDLALKALESAKRISSGKFIENEIVRLKKVPLDLSK